MSAANLAPAQTARLTEGPRNNTAQYMGKSAVDYPMFQAALQNQTAGEITLTTVTVHADGTGDDRGVLDAGTVRLVFDKDANGEPSGDTVAEPILGAGEYQVDNGTVTFDFSATPQKIAAGATIQLIVIYTLNGTANVGDTLRVYFDSAADFTLKSSATGDDVAFQSGAFPVNGLAKTIGQGNLTVSLLPDSVNTKISPYVIAGFPRSELLRLQFSNSGDERIVLRSIRFSAGGSADESLLIKPDALEFIPLSSAGLAMAANLPAAAVSSFSENNGTIEMTFDPAIALGRNEVKYASLAVSTNIVTAEYAKNLRFFMEEGAVAVDGVDSLVSNLDVIGEALSGPTRPYQGHANVASYVVNNVASAPRGAADVGAFPIQIINGPYEDVDITSMTLAVSGSFNDAAEFEKVTLWIDRGTTGKVNPPESGGTTDIEVESFRAFPEDNGSLTFRLSPPLRVAKSGTARFLLGADIATTATLGRQFRLTIPNAQSVSGVGVTSGAPTSTTGAPVNGAVITIAEPDPLTAPAYTIYEGSSTIELKERSALPRTGSAVMAWNFAAPINNAEDLYFVSAKVQMLGDVDETAYMERVELWFDKSRDGAYDKANPAADVKMGEVAITADNQELVFLPLNAAVSTTLIPRNRDNNFYLLLVLKDAPTSIYGSKVQFRIPDAGSLVLKGKVSGLDGSITNAPLTSREKTIMQPRATLVPGPRIIPPRTVLTCINNCGAETVQFQLTAGPSENVKWQSLSLEAEAVGEGLNSHASTPLVHVDGNSNGEIDNSDFPMSFRPYPFSEGTSTVDLESDLLVLLPGYNQGQKDLIQLPWGKKATYLVSICLGSNEPVDVDGTVSFQGTVPKGSLKLIGEDSGDEVAIDNDNDLVGQINQMTLGSVAITNKSTGIANYALKVPPGSPIVEAMVITLTTSIIEPVMIETLEFDVDTSRGTSLSDILDATSGARLAIKINSTTFAPIATGTIDFGNGTIRFTPGSFDSPSYNNFYSYYSTPNTTLAVLLKTKSTAPLGETLLLSLCDPEKQKFSGTCSLIDEDRYPITPLIEPGCLGRPITFDTTSLTISLTNATEDFPDVAFPGNNSNYAVVRLNLDADLKVEGVKLQRLEFHTSGTAHDADALTTGNGVRLFFNGVFQKEGVFSGDDGKIVFDGLNNLDISATRKIELQFNPGKTTRAFQNIGQTFNLRIEPGGIGAVGVLSGLPVTRFITKDKQVQTITGELPFHAPTIRIGAGRVFTLTDQVTAFATRHVRSTPNVVSTGFSLRSDRAEALDLEEILITTAGTMNDVSSLAGASVRVYQNATALNVFDAKDVPIGVGAFDVDDGTARVRFTPARRLTATSLNNFLMVVDLNGNPKEFETFTHSLVANTGVVVRGVSSSDYATPWYATSRSSDPNAGRINGPQHSIARAVLDFVQSTRLAQSTAASPSFILPSATDLPILSFDLYVDTIENCNATSFTLQNYGTAELDKVASKVRLYVDANKNGRADTGDIEVGQTVPTAGATAVTIPFTQVQGLLGGSNHTWLVTYDIDAEDSVYQTIQGGLNLLPKTAQPTERIVGGIGVKSGESIGVKRSQTANLEFKGPYYKFTSGIIEVRRGTQSPASIRIAEPNVQNLVLAQLLLTEPYNLEAAKMTRMEFNPKSTQAMDFATALAGATFSLYREGAGTLGALDELDTLLGTGAYNPIGGRIEIDITAVEDIIAKKTAGTYLLTGSFNVPGSEFAKNFFVEFAGPELAFGTGQTSNLPSTFTLPAGPFNTSNGAVTFAASTNVLTQEGGQPSGSYIIPTDEAQKPVMVFSVKPNSASDLAFKRLVLEAYESMNDATSFTGDGVRLYQDNGNGSFGAGDTLAASGTFTADNGRCVLDSFLPGITIPKDTLRRFFVVINLNGSATDESKFGIRIPNEPDAIQLVTKQTNNASVTTIAASTAVPITTGPWRVLARRLAVTNTPPGVLADFGAIPATKDLLLFRGSGLNTPTETVLLTTATLTLFTNSTLEEPFEPNSIRLYFDADGSGGLSKGDTVASTGTYDVATKQVRFRGITGITFLAGTAGTRKYFYVLANLARGTTFGETFRTNLTDAAGVGSVTFRRAIIDGLPVLSPTITVTPPTVEFSQAGAETAHPAVLNAGGEDVLHTLLLNTDGVDDVKLKRLTFEHLKTTQVPEYPAASSDVILSGSLKLVLDVVRDGRFDPTKDTVLGDNGYLVDSKVTFGPSESLIPRGVDTYLLLVGKYDGSTTGSSVTFRANAEGAEFVSREDPTLSFIPTGLPQTSGSKLLVSASSTYTFPYFDDFESAANTMRPSLAWSWVSDPAHARSGSGYYTGSTLTRLPRSADYALSGCYPMNLSGWPGSKRISFWVRSYMKPGTTFPAGEFDVFGPGDATWGVLQRFNTNTSRWKFVRVDVPDKHKVSPSMIMRHYIRGATTEVEGTYVDIDRMTFLPTTAPQLAVRNFANAAGQPKDTYRGNPAYLVSFQLQNTNKNPVRLDEIGWWLQNDNGDNRRGLMTATRLAGKDTMAVNETVNFSYSINFSPAILDPRVELDFFIRWTDTGSNLTTLYDSSLKPLDINFIKPTAPDLIPFILRRVDDPVPSSDFDPNEDGPLDAADFMRLKSGS